ncbi:MAG: hypothetical protein JKX71_00065 [Amylibacter sp.]|nr:hypothetical protein [Amylibacter sp.]
MNAKRGNPLRKKRFEPAFGRWISHVLTLVMMTGIVVTLAIGVLFVRLKSGPLIIPRAQEIVADLAKGATEDFDIHVGDVSLVAAKTGLNILVQLSDLQIFTKAGQNIAEFPIVRAKLNPIQSLLYGVDIKAVEIIGAEFRILRDLSGKYNILPPGNDNTDIIELEEVFAAVNIAARKSPLRGLRLIDIVDTNLVYIDQIKKRVWTSSKVAMKSTREGDVISAFANVSVTSKNHDDMSVGLQFTYGLDDDYFGFGVKFNTISTVDLADQVLALDWLRNFDAAVTGSINTEVSVDGVLNNLSGVLETGAGNLRDSPETKPINFDTLKAYFEYAKETDSLVFNQISAKSAVGSLSGEGSISMSRDAFGSVNALSGAVTLSELQINPKGVFAQPLSFDLASAQIEITFAPFSIQLEAAKLVAGDLEISMTGSSSAGEKYWNSSYDMQFNKISHAQVMQFWPLNAKKKTRDWIDENVLGGIASNGIGKLRTENGKPGIDLKFDLTDGKVRYMKTLPVLQGAVGRGHLTEKMFRADLTEGFVIAPDKGRLDLSNTSFTVPDLTVKSAVGDVILNVTGGLQSALSMLDAKPFEFLQKANLKPSLATGRIKATGSLSVPLKAGTKPEQISFQTTAQITDLVSTTLVKNRTVTADQVIVKANDRSIELSGEVMLDGIVTQTKWTMPIGKKRKKRSDLISEVKLNEANLRQLGVKFEKGTVTGEAAGTMRVILRPKQRPEYTLTSDMVGLGLNVSALNWVKPAKSKGTLSLRGRLGEGFTVDDLSVNTAGLSAKGAIQFNDDNSFKQVDFANLTVGRWLNAAVSVEGTGVKVSNITVSSGSADLRNVSFSKGAKTGAPMDVLLDRLILADGIILTNLRAKLRTEKGLRGTYTARVNGGAEIYGTIFPQKNGTAAEVNAVDAGAVLRAANLYSKGQGGKLRMIVLPLEKEGHYKGTFIIKKASVKQDNILADLLNSISVIGLVQQLSGDGIAFEKIDGQFTLKPQGVELRKISAVGVSIGLTMDGNYNSNTKGMNFEGVITPLYALNGSLERVFGKIFGRRKGEGLFSFVYKVSGTSTDPKVSVNPLSILTPGLFREMFRTKMPNIGMSDTLNFTTPAEPQKKATQTNDIGNLTLEIDR